MQFEDLPLVDVRDVHEVLTPWNLDAVVGALHQRRSALARRVSGNARVAHDVVDPVLLGVIAADGLELVVHPDQQVLVEEAHGIGGTPCCCAGELVHVVCASRNTGNLCRRPGCQVDFHQPMDVGNKEERIISGDSHARGVVQLRGGANASKIAWKVVVADESCDGMGS